MKLQYKLSLVLLLFTNVAFSHPDGMKPYWYPSAYTYGFVKGCWQSFTEKQAFTEFWPAEIQEVCGCVLDSLRHSLTWEEVESKDSTKFDEIVAGVLPICILEQTQKKEKNKHENTDPYSG